MNFYFLIMVTTILLSSVANGQMAPPVVPNDVRERTEFDQSYNINSQKPLPLAERKTVPIYHVEIPEEYVLNLKADDLDQETAKFAFVRKNGRNYVRLFFLGPENDEYKRYVKMHGKQPQIYWGTKYQSHGTFLVWNPNDHSKIYIKFPTKDGVTYHRTARNAVILNNYLAQVFAEVTNSHVDNDGLVTYFPERLGLSVGPYSISFRNAKPEPLIPDIDSTIRLLPLHGFLGSLFIEKCAAARGVTVPEYIVNEYAPALAKFIARTNFEMGIYTEAHTQNLLAYVDKKSGNIKGFAFRDLNDVAIDPFIRIAKGKKPIIDPIYGEDSVSQLGIFHMGTPDGGPKAKKMDFGAGWINGGYIGNHNFFAVSHSHRMFEKLMSGFMETFILETERITGITIDRKKIPSFISNSSTVFAPGYDAFQEIYEQVVAFYTRNTANDSGSYAQNSLRKIFFDHMENSGLVALVRHNARMIIEKDMKRQKGFRRIFHPKTHLEFSFDGKNIVAYDRFSNSPIAFAYGLSKKEMKKVNKSRIKIKHPGIGINLGSACLGPLKRILSLH